MTQRLWRSTKQRPLEERFNEKLDKRGPDDYIRSSDAPAKILAHHYGVTPALVNLVRARKVWAHV